MRRRRLGMSGVRRWGRQGHLRRIRPVAASISLPAHRTGRGEALFVTATADRGTWALERRVRVSRSVTLAGAFSRSVRDVTPPPPGFRLRTVRRLRAQARVGRAVSLSGRSGGLRSRTLSLELVLRAGDLDALSGLRIAMAARDSWPGMPQPFAEGPAGRDHVLLVGRRTPHARSTERGQNLPAGGSRGRPA